MLRGAIFSKDPGRPFHVSYGPIIPGGGFARSQNRFQPPRKRMRASSHRPGPPVTIIMEISPSLNCMLLHPPPAGVARIYASAACIAKHVYVEALNFAW